jgi:hypothetical protein
MLFQNKLKPKLVNNISSQDYVLCNKTTEAPIEALDIVYHHSTLVELINDGFKLGHDETFICAAALPLKWQRKINEAIEATK